MTDLERLDAVIAKRGEVVIRKEPQSIILATAVTSMRARRHELGISERSIAIVDYLARNPRAEIILEPNVACAFRDARRALTA